MTRILLIPCGKTFWDQEARLAGAADLPLSRQGQQDALALAGRLRQIGVPEVICTGCGQAEVETARIIAQALGCKTRRLEGLEEPDMGLWEGLTAQELQQRYPKAFRQLAEQPTQVAPPSGEPLGEAQGRLVQALDQISQKRPNETVGMVVGPLAERLLTDWIRGGRFESHWSGREKPEIVVLHADGSQTADTGDNLEKT